MNTKLIQKLKEIIADMHEDEIIEVIEYAEYLQNKDNDINEMVRKKSIDIEINKDRIRVLKSILNLGIEFSDEILSDITQLTREQIVECKKESKDRQ